ncbi:hypothetical protein B0T17DRAFT_476251, partial [Bombardia bombarda]
WARSALNPANRVDVLPTTTASSSKWRIDGAATFKTRFFAVPLELMRSNRLSPLRIDVFLPDQGDYPSALRQSLDASTGVPLQHPPAVAALGISRYLCRLLDHYCAQHPTFLEGYQRLPFGSRIIIADVVVNIAQAKLEVEPNYSLEGAATSFPVLKQLWTNEIATDQWPPAIDIFSLRTVRQVHDSVTLVRIEEFIDRPELEGHLAIFKSGTDEFHHMLHELKLLLTIPPHPNIIGQPLAVVTKKCGFGGKQGVFGFLIPYLPAGSIRDILPAVRADDPLAVRRGLKWCKQLTSALIHVWKEGGTFYSDLRPDNVLLNAPDTSASGSPDYDVVLCDFEQRGNWHEWCAPEILYPQYLENLRNNRRRFKDSTWDSVIEAYTRYRPPVSGETRVSSRNRPWFSLSKENQEKAMVFSLGLFLYCVFEGLSTVSPSLPYSFSSDPDIAFPQFRRTPVPIRELIERCTADSPLWRAEDVRPKRIVRKEGLLFSDYCVDSECLPRQTAHTVLSTARQSWSYELEKARQFFETDQWKAQIFGRDRPTLKEVMKLL